MLSDCPREFGISRFESVQDRTNGNGLGDIDCHFAADLRQISQMKRQYDADHFRVCTSTERTAGKSRTIAFHESPPSAEPYTCPPVVPKYTPHWSIESTAIASRRMFT